MKILDKKNRNNNDENDNVNDLNNSHIKSTDIESYLEVLLLPKRQENRNMDIVQTFDTEVQLAMKEYLDKLTEEVNEDQMCNLKRADSSVMDKEDSLREIREEIERERRAQELLFKELKVFSNENNPKNNNKGPQNMHRSTGGRK
eukprot:CAMPEP_0119049844 /NCGR_PEP_ID=MMETSP1177-20130426/66723_1 /TAXON_ID=2985 /ORGANISM="Ochromonas sp, Strain CCMP1899" /LENGTH=144 /DNA_ID=CAMNT_0007027559 /DNA_START=108 /DNA_END=542 /DNA_ORIENTATION=-